MYNATVYIYTMTARVRQMNYPLLIILMCYVSKLYVWNRILETKGGLQNILGWTNKIFPWGTCPHSHPPLMTHAGIPCKRSSCLGNAVAVEMLITGVLVLVVFASAADPVNSIQVKGSAPLAIG